MNLHLDRLFRRRRSHLELDEEIQTHLAMATRDRVEEGEDPQAAAAAARREFGNSALVQEITRTMWRWNAVATFWQDVRYALRRMRRSPVFAAVAVLSLALGIGANTTIFSVVNALMLRPLPVRNPTELVELLFKAPGQDHFNAFDWRNFQYYSEHNHVFSGMIAASDTPFAIHGEGLEPETVRGGYVSTNYFPTLGVNAVRGRLIRPEDGGTGSPANVAVVSWSYWVSRLHSDPAVVGRQIANADRSMTIIGVAPKGFAGLEPANRQDIWFPLTAVQPRNATSAKYWLKLAARLKPGVSIGQARAEMSVLWRWTQEEEFKLGGDRTVRNWKMEVQPAATGLTQLRDQFGKPALALMGVVALLLLIACANIAGLLLARGAARRREMAVRVSLGAGRFRLLRQELTESVVLSVSGAVLGILLANWGTKVLSAIMGSGRLRVELQARPDSTVLLFTAGVALLCGVLFGMAPAWQTFHSAPMFFLRESAKAGETRGRRRFVNGLVVMQVALSIALLSAAGLLIRHLSQLEHLDLGFQRDHVLLVTLNTAGSGYDGERLSRGYQELLRSFEAIPGVRSATMCGFFPMAGVGAMRPATVEGYQAKPGERRFLSQNWVAPHYFATFGIPLLMGRDFSLQDQDRPRVAIVNQTLSHYFFGESNPIGKHIVFDGDSQPFEIVGVVRDAKSGDLREPPLRFVYLNSFQLRRNSSQFVLSTAGAPEAIAGDVRRVVRGVLKGVGVEDVKTMDAQVDGALVPERLSAILSGLFSGLGALLAALGLYGLLAYSVTRRTNEIGIRAALGATRGNIARMLLGDALRRSAAGLAIGACMAYWGNRFVASLIPGVSVESGTPILMGGSLMLMLALLAAYLPSRRAARVDPMEALRYE